jgi:hypothetical protein
MGSVLVNCLLLLRSAPGHRDPGRGVDVATGFRERQVSRTVPDLGQTPKPDASLSEVLLNRRWGDLGHRLVDRLQEFRAVQGGAPVGFRPCARGERPGGLGRPPSRRCVGPCPGSLPERSLGSGDPSRPEITWLATRPTDGDASTLGSRSDASRFQPRFPPSIIHSRPS